jgi:hypothetical protein
VGAYIRAGNLLYIRTTFDVYSDNIYIVLVNYSKPMGLYSGGGLIFGGLRHGLVCDEI